MVHKSKTKTALLIILAIILAAGIAFAGWYYFFKPKTSSSLDVGEATKQQAEQSDVERAKSDENKNANQSGGANQPQSSSQASSVSVNITSAGQSGNNVYVNGIVGGTTSGTCKLVMTKGAKKVEKSASIGLQVSYYICQGFNISSSEFTEKGEWEAAIEVSSPNGGAQSEVRKVNVQ